MAVPLSLGSYAKSQSTCTVTQLIVSDIYGGGGRHAAHSCISPGAEGKEREVAHRRECSRLYSDPEADV